MARTSVTPQAVTLAGLAPTMTAPAGEGADNGDVVDFGRNLLIVTNSGSAAISVTIETPETIDGDLSISDRVVSVAVGATVLIPLTSRHYQQVSGDDQGRIYIDYGTGAATDLTRAVVSL